MVTILLVWLRSPGLMAEAMQRYRPDSKAVVFGHIHRPGVWRKQGRLIVNTGGFISITNARVVEVVAQELHVHGVSLANGEFRLERDESALSLE